MKKIVILLITVVIFGCNTSQEKKTDSNNEMLKQVQHNEKIVPTIEPNRYNVAFLIMDGVYNTELTAPFDIFQHTVQGGDIIRANFELASARVPRGTANSILSHLI